MKKIFNFLESILSKLPDYFESLTAIKIGKTENIEIEKTTAEIFRSKFLFDSIHTGKKKDW